MNSVGFLRLAWAGTRVLAGTGAGPVMFRTDGCVLPGLAMTGAATLRSPARFDAKVVPGAKPAPFPGFVEPCHPTLREEGPAGARWVREIKFDGYRTQAHLRNGQLAIYTRRGHDWTRRFQTIADALKTLPAKGHDPGRRSRRRGYARHS